ncbi:hypothetical protein MHBO_001965 [Bonamia ostreae]|uniref:Triacylglycerol lipase N-terminal domain-containing protein n=1 Tax=Bonamia ostreae TaxID=126728 RepID=A0ABV2AKU2_9EUKA
MKKDSKLKKSLKSAKNYEEFVSIAKKMDSNRTRLEWIKDENSEFFNAKEINALLTELSTLKVCKRKIFKANQKPQRIDACFGTLFPKAQKRIRF